MISIRAAQAADYPVLLGIWRRSVEGTHEFLSAADIDTLEQEVAGSLPQMSDLRIASQDIQPLGFIAIDANTVQMLFVDTHAQGQGIGSALLSSVTGDHDVIRVDVNEQNPSGRTFYAARGFTERGRSETDDQGRPFPILHLELTTAI